MSRDQTRPTHRERWPDLWPARLSELRNGSLMEVKRDNAFFSVAHAHC